MSFTSRAKGCIKFVPHSCLVSLSHKVGVFLEEAICYFIYAKLSYYIILLYIDLASDIANKFQNFGPENMVCLPFNVFVVNNKDKQR